MSAGQNIRAAGEGRQASDQVTDAGGDSLTLERKLDDVVPPEPEQLLQRLGRRAPDPRHRRRLLDLKSGVSQAQTVQNLSVHGQSAASAAS